DRRDGAPAAHVGSHALAPTGGAIRLPRCHPCARSRRPRLRGGLGLAGLPDADDVPAGIAELSLLQTTLVAHGLDDLATARLDLVEDVLDVVDVDLHQDAIGRRPTRRDERADDAAGCVAERDALVVTR